MFRRQVRVYVDTSVIGGCWDDEFSEPSRKFFELARQGQIYLLLSSVTLGELEGAPTDIRSFVQSLPADCFDEIRPTGAADFLQRQYLKARVVGNASRLDALHVATATVWAADVIVSWNFKHLVNWQRIQGFNLVNIGEGFRPIDIRTPREFLEDAQA